MKTVFFGVNMKVFFIIFFLLLLLDAVYISTFNGFLNKLFKRVQGGRKLSVKYGGFIATYLLMTSIVYYFGIIKKFTLSEMILLGISIFGVYDLTNYTTFIDWNLKMVVLDTLWGGVLFASITYLIKKLNLL
jgi:uncharacterized membrane protein